MKHTLFEPKHQLQIIVIFRRSITCHTIDCTDQVSSLKVDVAFIYCDINNQTLRNGKIRLIIIPC